ncbi:uncharacterized protein N7459_007060 [Penicillium hispanicum]|uniref:uncharacterized protein n=1 Tax=Penicillium hispanicum TaxID=1080232 RepID=UPI00254122E5|nr:uncharacterized protein N7459_007060 [Penicillium hispanicum]KAJ5578096.1 hypothetical protein N7459_007060 [Penicillium hispanicum]
MGSELGVTASSEEQIDLSPVSIWWACWACIWTAAVALGVAFLIARRNSPILRIRGLGLSLSAIALLHIYWASCQFGTMIGTIMPGDVQYWVMGTYLPCGIALFHASNTRFLHVSKLQKRYIHGSRLLDSPSDWRPSRGLVGRFRRLSYNTKILITVGVGMFAQIFLTILMFLISRKWHSSWGIPGTEVHGTIMEQRTAQGTGWEWWPGVFWQFFWSWIIAPIVLWKSRNIHDTHGWRVQTVGCAIANLHATPMWLIALYVPGMAPVNAVWIPPQWICLSIMFIEIFTVFLPCWEVWRCQTLRQETLDAITNWEAKNKGFNSESKSLNSSTSTMVESMLSGWKSMSDSVKSTNSNRASILTMTALEYVLERNPSPLQEFAALHDFSGENIAFLTSVAEWKSSLPKLVRDSTAATPDANVKELTRERFNRALHIYAEFISVHHAEFPVNISSHDLKQLEAIFEAPTRILYGEKREVDLVSPFGAPGFPEPPSPTSSESSQKPMRSSVSEIRDRVQYWGDVPEAFGANVFDAAEESIKYLVLTNTWAKFVRNRRASTDSGRTLQGVEIV